MTLIELDASGWSRAEHFYAALLPALGAPAWHGRNLDALYDSLFGGGINEVQPPLRVNVIGVDCLSEEMRAFLRKVEVLFADGRAETGLNAIISFDPPL